MGKAASAPGALTPPRPVAELLDHLTEVSGGRTVRRVARPRSASPAEGSAARHAHNQQIIIAQAFGGKPVGRQTPAASRA